nr:efflux RND transporter permease subunit [Rubrobacter sp.]
MSSIVRWCLANKSVVVLATLLLVGGGGYAATQLNQELLPDIEFPVVTVATPVPGAGPELVDEQVTQELEGAVEGVGNVESLQSTSSQGFSFIAVEFGLDADSEEVRDDLQRELQGVELPEQAGEPEVETQSADSFPILNVSLAAGGDRDLTGLTQYAQDEVLPLIEDVDGTGEVDLAGGSEGRIQVDLDPESLEEAGIPPEAVAGTIAEAESDAPAGDVEIEGLNTPVVVQSGVEGVEALRELPLGAPGGAPAGAAPEGGPPEGEAPEGEAPEELAEGETSPAPEEAPEPVLLGDVAGVEEVEENIGGISRTNGEPSVGINVSKEQDANTVEVAEGVEEALGEVREELGEEQVLVVFNSADDIEASVDGLIEKALLGAAFAVAVIFGFLRSVRATLVTAVSLPTSVLAALLFSWGDGLTLNILTLAGLTIAVGRVVDDSIVVLENSYRYIGEGLDPETAALKGTTEVASAITSSTLCTAAVFLPIGLVGGIVSEFFLPLSLTVAFALLASLLVAVTLIPVLVSLFLSRSGGEPSGRPGRLRRLLGGRGGEDEGDGSGDGLLVRLYTPALRWSLGHRLVVLLAALVVFVGGIGAAFFLPASFFPPSEARLLVADVELADGTALEESSEETRAFEDFLIGEPAVESYQLSVGGEDSLSGGFSSSQRADDEAQAFISVGEGEDVNAALE